MWEILIVLGVALVASTLTLFSGFGLGTLLLPAFALVFPLDVAIAATAVVHLANNVLKAGLLYKLADVGTFLRFGIPAMLAAFLGAGLLLVLEGQPLASYDLLGTHQVTALGLVVGSLIVIFALFDLVPRLKDWTVDRKHLPIGGALSGFFGGLSGHQGALRSVFLTKVGLSAQAFIATATLCAILVDVSRLVVYSGRYADNASTIAAAGGWTLIGGACLMAFLGAFIGKRLIGKVTIGQVRTLVGVMLLLVGSAVAAGLV